MKKDDLKRLGCMEYRNEELYNFWNFKERRKTILDLGSGLGMRSRFLSSRGFNVIAVDINKNTLFSKNYNGISRLVCDAQCLPFRRGVFNGVFCIEVLEHLECPQECVKNVAFVLKNKGEVLWVTPCLNIPVFRNILVLLYRKLLNQPLKAYELHKSVFSDSQLSQLFQQYFNVVKVKYSRHTVLLTRLFGINRCFWDQKLQIFPFPFLRLFAQGIMILCRKGGTN